MMFSLLIIEAEGPHLTCILEPRQKNRNRQNHTVLGLCKFLGPYYAKCKKYPEKLYWSEELQIFLSLNQNCLGVKSVLGEIMLAKDPL